MIKIKRKREQKGMCKYICALTYLDNVFICLSWTNCDFLNIITALSLVLGKGITHPVLVSLENAVSDQNDFFCFMF